MGKYFYFRDVADEASDLDALASLTIPVSRITAFGPHASNTSLNIWFKSLKNEKENEYVTLTVTQGKIQEVIHELVSNINGAPHNDGFIVVADAVTTTDGASSIQGDDKVVSTKFLSSDISGVSIATN